MPVWFFWQSWVCGRFSDLDVLSHIRRLVFLVSKSTILLVARPAAVPCPIRGFLYSIPPFLSSHFVGDCELVVPFRALYLLIKQVRATRSCYLFNLRSHPSLNTLVGFWTHGFPAAYSHSQNEEYQKHSACSVWSVLALFGQSQYEFHRSERHLFPEVNPTLSLLSTPSQLASRSCVCQVQGDPHHILHIHPVGLINIPS